GLLRAMGDLPAARPYLERALAIFEVKLGPDHPNTRIVRGNLSRVS
ncbi:MAG: tetratricopeptide repeat protein, partial [Anaerolineae bacterium]|nr:tetratricopeptide repeat protein [Anaerolineae bacterium]